MTLLKRWSGVGTLLALLVVLSLAAPVMVPAEAEAAAGAELKDSSWKEVTLLYTSDVKGKIEPCG
jgi:hypothetical protein